ncbi:hypothetical protein ATANTOWER_031151 [Ataeniobius toweri]|uniref:Uncharacterized protein n=1 Tax=Ataeniobius toweri TaxID=208326 RepID=A0ABU7AJ64_9TELE|nr:hypothetical protein [Ataeniobius toweri]
MTPLDPIEEFMFVCQQRVISALVSPILVPQRGTVEEAGCSKSCAFIWTVASQEVRSYSVSWLCQKKVNALYFESSRKVRIAFPVVTHGCGSQHHSLHYFTYV